MPEDSSEGEDDDQDEDENPANKDGESELDDDIDLSSPFPRNMLSDEQPVQDFEGITIPTIIERADMRNHEPTEEEWENM
jgi:hypothetical protein